MLSRLEPHTSFFNLQRAFQTKDDKENKTFRHRPSCFRIIEISNYNRKKEQKRRHSLSTNTIPNIKRIIYHQNRGKK